MHSSGVLRHLRCQSAAFSRTERQMILLQWGVMLAVASILWYTLRSPEPLPALELGALLLGTVVLQPLSYEMTLRLAQRPLGTYVLRRHTALTALDVTIGTIFYLQALEHPEFAQIILFCVVALAATRYPLGRALGITSLISLLLVFSNLLSRVRFGLQVADETIISSVLSLYVVTYLVALVSAAERRENAIARDNERLYRTVLDHNRELNAINHLGHVLEMQQDVETMLSEALTTICATVNAPLGWIYRVTRCAEAHGTPTEAASETQPARDGRLTLAACHGPTGAGAEDARWREHVMEAVRCRDMVVTSRTVGARPGGGSGVHDVAVPLLVQDSVFAVLQVVLQPADGDVPRRIGAPELQTLRILCNELAVGIDNTLLRHEVQQAVILQEKNRIAQELHDTVAQILFTIGLGLEWCLNHAAPQSDLYVKLRDLRRLSAQGTAEVRSAIFTLSSTIGHADLVPAIGAVVREMGTKYGWRTNMVVTGTPAEQPPLLVQNAIHRLVREGMINIYKHAQATEVMVSLRFAQGQVTVVVQDNGVGQAARVQAAMAGDDSHFGLRTLQTQVAGLGGLLDIYDADERGLVVRAIIPLQAGGTPSHDREAPLAVAAAQGSEGREGL
ncbi:MAG: hypothetical protein NVSMB65_07000 [Chloroflexota bacterium]